MKSTSTKQQQHQMRTLIWCLFFVSSASIHATRLDSINVDSCLRTNLLSNEIFVARVEKDSIRNVQYTQFGDLLYRATALTPMSLGSLGQRDGVEIFGDLPSEQVLSRNGVPLSSAGITGFHPLYIAPIAVERIEVLAGTLALGKLPHMSLTGINVVQRQFNAASPFTSMWFHQGAGESVAGNVAFAQNASDRVSVDANIRRMGARGLYQQTDYDSWNVHLNGRYALGTSSALSLSYDLTTIDADQWSGTAQDPYSGAGLAETLEPKRQTSREIIRRHDVALTHAYADAESTRLRVDNTAYASNELRRIGDSLDSGSYLGVISSVDYQFERLLVHGGLNASSSGLGAWSYVRFDVLSGLSAISSVRYDAGSSGGIGFGGALQYRDSIVAIKFDASRISANSTLSSSSLLYVHAQWRSAAVLMQTYLYRRSFDGDATASDGLILSLTGVMGTFEATATIRAMVRAGSLINATTLIGNAEAAYVYATGASTIRFGASVAIVSAGELPQYDVTTRSFSVLPTVATGQQYDGLGLFARANVGTASIRASFENVLGKRWYTVAYMPAIPRQFRLSVDWTFVD
jgi:hypothetical protein